MGESVGAIELDLELNDRGFDKSVNSIAGTAKKVGRTLAAAFAIDKIVGFGKECLDLGSDLAEVQNVVDVAFGPTVSKKINSFAKSAAQSFGLSETMAKKYAGTFGSMATAFGFSQDQAADMSTQLTGLAGDVASFYNISQDEAYTKLKSVFTGETESLKDLGVVMTQTALDSYAMANGFGKTTAQMSEAEKVALRYSFVQNQLSNAAGDFARTSDSWANQTRILALQFDSLRASIGQGLINLFQPIIVQVNALLKKIVGLSSAFVKLTELLTGKKSSDNGVADTADMAAKADDNMSGAAKSASTLTKNTKAAGKAAKKAAKEMFGLASWDELSNNTSSKSDNKDASSKAATGSSGGSTSKAPSGSALDDTTKSAGKLSTALDAVRKKFDELKKLFVKGFQIGLGNTSSVFKSIKNELKSIGKTFQSIFTDPGLLTAASNCVNKIVLALGKITGSIASIGLTIADNLLGGISLYLKQHKKDLIEDLTALFNITGEIATIVGNFSVVLAQIATVFRSKDAKLITASIISIFAEAVTNVAVLVAKFGKDVLNLITSPIIANKDAIKKALSNTIAPVSKIIQSISAVWSNTWTKIQTFYNQHISPLFATITGSVTQWIQTFLNGYNQHIAPVLSAFATKFKAVMEQYVQPAINAVIDAFGDFVDVVAAVWKAALQPLVNWCIAKIVPVFAKLFKTAGDITGKTGSTLSALRSSTDELINLLDDMRVLIETTDKYVPTMLDSLSDSEELMNRLTKTLYTTHDMLSLLNDTLISAGDSLDASTKATLQGMEKLLDKNLTMIDNISAIREAGDSMKSTLDEQLDKFEDENNFLNMDPEADKISFTSSKNPSPNSVQIVLRTDEISDDDDATDISDQESTSDSDEGPLKRMWNVLVAIVKAIIQIFQNR